MAIEKLSYKVHAIDKDVAETVEAACDALALEYEGSDCLADYIQDVSDSYCPDDSAADYNRLLAAVADIEESIGAAISEGLIETRQGLFSLRKLLQVGYYEYLTTALYENLGEIIFNHLADKWNRGECNTTDDNSSSVIEDIVIEEAIKDIAFDDPDNNNSFDYYESKLNEAIEIIKADNDEGSTGE